MPYELHDYIPGRVLYCQIFGEYTPAEMRQSNADVIAYLDRYQTPVHVISDFSQMTNFVHDVPLLMQTFSFFAHPHQGWAIVISADPMVRVVSAAVVQQIKPVEASGMLQTFADRQTALAFLARIDLTLPALPPLPIDKAAS